MLDYGAGTSRTLDPTARQYSGLVWQENKPPCDAEISMISQVSEEARRDTLGAMLPSGFFSDPTRSLADYQFDPLWSNRFLLGKPRTLIGTQEGLEQAPIITACVNGWIIPVVGTDVTSTDRAIANVVNLYPPPTSDARTDYVFLEVWQARVDANPSLTNKPSASTLWKYGNVKFGGTNLTDDLEDPAIGFSTTGRVQVQYRIRVYGRGEGLGSSVNLTTYPDGLGDPNILGQGASTAPVGGFRFTNMRETLGDPSLWRAGDGDPANGLGTVDGYVYAIPICAVFRRNILAYMAVQQAGLPNQNGSKERTPHSRNLADPLSGACVLKQATLGTTINAADTGTFTVNVTDLNGCGLEDVEHAPYTNTFLMIDNELFGIDAIDRVLSTIEITSRGRYGTAITRHEVGANINVFNSRPDGLYADQIAETDILDLRRAVTAHDWDYQRLLQHNVAALVRGDLKTAWKKSVDGDTEGTTVHEVDYLLCHAGGASPSGVQRIDGPDGIRTVFSDAACIQRDVTLLLDPAASKVAQYASTLDANVAWDVGPDFHPAAFFNTAGYVSQNVWTNGSVIFLHLGGDDGISGARSSFKDSPTQAVRALMPVEYWKTGYPVVDPSNGNQYPVTMRFLDRVAEEPAPECLNPTGHTTGYVPFAERHSGPMFPWAANNFEYPFIVLGGIVHPDLTLTLNALDFSSPLPGFFDLDTGINFDAPNIFYTLDSYGNVLDDPSTVAKPMLNGRKTMWNLLTKGGQDLTGQSSELYVVLYGDTDALGLGNNGAFQVVGAGTTLTQNPASSSTNIRLKCLSLNLPNPTTVTAKPIQTEFRSVYSNADDLSSSIAGFADIAVVFTDLGGIQSNNPWSLRQLGWGDPAGYDLTNPTDSGKPYIASKALLNLSLLYHPGRGGMARVPDDLLTVAKKYDPTVDLGAYLRQSRATLDASFVANAGLPTNETYWEPMHIQTWNRLPSLGWNAPDAPAQVGAYGGNVVGFTEQDREHEAFFDRGSKTLLFRPFRDREMTVKAQTVPAFPVLDPVNNSLLGPLLYKDGAAKDSGSIWTSLKTQGFAVPREFMPRFGRQDIPFWVDLNAGAGPFLSGINHLFTDQISASNIVFTIIGGESNLGAGPLVKSMFFITGSASSIDGYAYGHRNTFTGLANNQPFIGARKTTSILGTTQDGRDIIAKLGAVNSSDFGKGLKGIQLPPYYGPARVYGVYDVRDYIAAGGHSFNAARTTLTGTIPGGGLLPNLLKEDGTEQTLFILEGGAKDYTGSNYGGASPRDPDCVDDHTYIIPSNEIDITRAANYHAGDKFEDYHYVVECAVFGFARGFINKNNYVLTRSYNGAGVNIVDGTPMELDGIRMVIPAPAGISDNLYTAYNRAPYQGDPFMSRGGDAQATSDYEDRYGQLTIGSQYQVRTPIQQFNTTTGQFMPEIPNARAFEILSSMDFYTTMGTGKIGGQLSPGTSLDVGFTEDTLATSVRMPSSGSSPAWRILPRAFTEGQLDNPTQATLNLAFSSGITPLNLNPLPAVAYHHRLRFGLLDGTYLDMYASFPDGTNRAPLLAAGILTNQIWDLDPDGVVPQSAVTKDLEFTSINVSLGTSDLHPGEILEFSSALPNASLGGLSVYMANAAGNNGQVALQVRLSGPNTVVVRAIHTWSDFPFANLPTNHTTMDVVASRACSILSIAAGTSGVLDGTFTITDANAVTDLIAVTAVPPGAGDQAVYTATVTGPGTIQVTCHNIGTAAITSGNHTSIKLAVVRDAWTAYTNRTYNLTGKTAVVSLTRKVGSFETCALNLASSINQNPTLSQNMYARANGTTIELIAIPRGAEGNILSVTSSAADLHIKLPNAYTNTSINYCVFSHFLGGSYYPSNAGVGNSQINLTGMTERLPMGVLLQDSDFLCENPLDDNASAMKSSPVGPQPIQSIMPLTSGGEEFTRFMGEPGSLVAQSDGSVCVSNFTAWTQIVSPGGTKSFRTYRGGGPAFVLSGNDPGGPIDWVSESMPAPITPVLKGGALVCRAMLVRNFYEEVNISGQTYPVSYGDEIQMVVVTNGILGDGFTREDGLTLNGVISPSGYGEGMAASDRYRIEGRPMFRGRSQWTPNPNDVTLAVYPDGQRQIPTR